MLSNSRSAGNVFRQLPLSGLVLLVLIELLGCTDAVSESSKLREPAVSVEEEASSEEEAADSAVQEYIYVHVCGEVNAPGVYELPAGSRVYEGIEAAGGMTEEAAPACLNQAQELTDGQQLYVLSVQEAESAGQQGESAVSTQAADDGRVNLNTASKEELMTLNGIGEARADAIIRYREEHGGFTSVEELKEIEGIKDGIFNKVKDQIKVS